MNQMNTSNDELEKQELILWQRGKFFTQYENILGRYIVQSVLENMQPGRLLDLACGSGDLTGMMATHFAEVVGLDASSNHLADARLQHQGITFVHSLAEDYHDRNGFNTITMINLLEHVQNPPELLRAAARNLLPDGVLMAHVPNAMAINRKIAKIMGSLVDEYELSPFDINIAGHRRSYDLDLLHNDFEAAGLKIKKMGGVFYKMLSTPQINWLLENGPWEEGGFGWGRVGAEKEKDWRQAFCDACYEYGKQRPEDCNIIYAVGTMT
jgi:2-polyprenyl-3-methyl-5-hydroxy-6-metoxy-1,4-benzoquinol methylase